MKVAILLMCHKSIEMVNLLIEALNDSRITVFVHADKKMATEGIKKQDNVVILEDDLRVNVSWAQISQVDATLNLIGSAKSYGKFDYYWLCSGQDYLINNIEHIIAYLEKNSHKDFINFFHSRNNGANSNEYDKRNEIKFPLWLIDKNSFVKKVIKRLYVEFTGGKKYTFKIFRRRNRLGVNFYFGATWWCLREEAIDYMLSYLQSNPEYYKYFSKCLCPDESFFHTLYMNSQYSNDCLDYLHYVDWSEGKNSPKYLIDEDFEMLIQSEFLMARKFEFLKSASLLEKLKQYISD